MSNYKERQGSEASMAAMCVRQNITLKGQRVVRKLIRVPARSPSWLVKGQYCPWILGGSAELLTTRERMWYRARWLEDKLWKCGLNINTQLTSEHLRTWTWSKLILLLASLLSNWSSRKSLALLLMLSTSNLYEWVCQETPIGFTI